MTLLKGCSSFALLVVLLLFVICYFHVGARLAADVNREGLLALRPGMAEQQVLDLIGPPLEKKPAGRAFLIAGKATSDAAVRWTYGEPGFCGGCLEISLLIDKGVLISAGIESYDLGAYWCNEGECPVVWNVETFNHLRARRPAPTGSYGE